MKFYETSSIFHFTWDQVVQGFWQKYPNPYSKHVLSEDTVLREVRGNKLYSKRLLTKTNHVPKWGERFISSRSVKIVEESVVDLKAKTLVTYTRNIGYTRVMSIIERVVYRPSAENSGWTVAERSAWVDSQVYGFARAIQAFGLDRFKKNCQKMSNGFNFVLNNLYGQHAVLHAASPPGGGSLSLEERKEKIRGAAKKATELAKSKAGPIYASCQPGNVNSDI